MKVNRPPRSINRMSVLVYPRYTTNLGHRKTQYYDSKWSRAVNEVASHPKSAMVVVGVNNTKALSPHDLALLRRAKTKLGDRLVVIREKSIPNMKSLLQSRNLHVVDDVVLVGMGQHYSKETSGQQCVEGRTLDVKAAIERPRAKVSLDRRRSMRDPIDVIESIIKSARPDLDFPARQLSEYDAQIKTFLLDLGQFTTRNLISYSRIAFFAKKYRRAGLLREAVQKEVERKVSSGAFLRRLSLRQVESLLSFFQNRDFRGAVSTLKRELEIRR